VHFFLEQLSVVSHILGAGVADAPLRPIDNIHQTVIPGGMEVFSCAERGTLRMFQEEQHISTTIVLGMLLDDHDEIIVSAA
jgi:hypothetical protein